MEKFYAFFAFLGVMIFVIVIAYFFYKKPSPKKKNQRPLESNWNNSVGQNHSNGSVSTEKNVVSTRISRKDYEKQVQRQDDLNSLVEDLRRLSQKHIWSLDDLSAHIETYLNGDELMFLAKQLPTSIFASTIWEIHQKIETCQLSDDQIVKVLEFGTESLVSEFINNYSTSSSWLISPFLLDKFIANNPLLVFRFTQYRKELVNTIIEKLSVYELLGYRVVQKIPEEEIEGSILDLSRSTEDNEVEISYYDSITSDIISFLEKHYPNEIELRQKAFKKVLEGSNLVSMISSVDHLDAEEVKKIISRQYPQEIESLFDSLDSAFISSCFEFDYVVKAILGIIPSDFSEVLKDNYAFGDEESFKAIIDQLSAQELLGTNDYDIISLIEDEMSDNEELRKLAFAKICESEDISKAISRWGDLSEEEIAVIVDRNNSDELTALFDRDDNDDIVGKLPEKTAIKVRLSLAHSDFSEVVKDNYSFEDVESFKAIIDELSARELLGSDDYDIISLIEDEMSDNAELRKLAFAKICESEDISQAIARWGDLSEEEIAVIVDRNNSDELTALFDRDDNDDVVGKLPEKFAIKVILGLLYPDVYQTLKDNYSFEDEELFKEIIDELSARELLGSDDYDIISLIEDEMSDNEELRKLAFAKICESEDISQAIARWDNVSEDEVPIIVERKNDEEINALLERDDSDDLITNLPEKTAIKVSLGLLYPGACEAVKDNYGFGNEDAFKEAITELTAKELLGTDDYDIIKLIEDEMQDNEELRKLAFAKICESEDISEAISRWETISKEEISTIVERKNDEEINALLERDDFDDIIADLPDIFVVKQHLLGDNDSIHDEYSNRIDDLEFRPKVEKIAKALGAKKLTNAQKEGDTESLSDEILIKAMLDLVDLDDCSFDMDDITSEYSSRIENQDFRAKVEILLDGKG